MLESFLLSCQQRVNGLLTQCLPTNDLLPQRLHQAMHYAVLQGGKRIRPTLVYAVGETLGCSWHKLDSAACAIELIHAYSLVHDDLPAMDNDSYRRGQLTCHKAFDEATAILVGDALQSLAFQLVSEDERLTAEQRIRMVKILAAASGSQGMAGGQALDLAAINKAPSLQELDQIHQLKTGALLCACVELALVPYEIDSASSTALLHYAKLIGLAFQIRDDMLDHQISAQRQEASYTTNFSLQQATDKLQDLQQQAIDALQQSKLPANLLQQLANYLAQRSQ
jgi:geranylgeranyl pyrophosphate synthase